MGRYEYGKSKQALRPNVPTTGVAAAEGPEATRKRTPKHVPGRSDETDVWLAVHGSEIRAETPPASAFKRVTTWVPAAVARVKATPDTWFHVKSFRIPEGCRTANVTSTRKKLMAEGLEVVKADDQDLGVTKVYARFVPAVGGAS